MKPFKVLGRLLTGAGITKVGSGSGNGSEEAADNGKPSRRPPVKWYGGKYYLAPWIVSYFPECRQYVEPFGGGASVLLCKDVSSIEVYNDLDHRIVRFFHVLRDQSDELRLLLTLTPFSEGEFYRMQLGCLDKEMTEVEAARMDYVLWRQSYSGLEDTFVPLSIRTRRNMDQNISAWLSAIDDLLPDITQRLREVVILERDAIELITTEIYDKSDTLIYCDPPYMPGTRVNPSAYGVEADEEYHAKLAVVLLRSKAKVILSGYRCEQYDEWYKGWVRKDKDVVVNVSKEKSGGKGTRVESLWLNFVPEEKDMSFL